MQPGDVVAERFEIVAAVGAGGMGEIHRAIDRVSQQMVALKVLRNVRGEPMDAERFTREARVLDELRHPAIVRHVAHGLAPGGLRWLAMEWLEGEDLWTRLRRGRLSIHESLDLSLRVSRALGTAHARGIVHRDVKPANLFLVGGEVSGVKLLDFGIARAGGRGALPALTRTGASIGTPGYMSPEQARGDREVDARADVFSLGCVLYECLTGVPAFAGEHVMAILAKILLEEAPRLNERLPEAPAQLVELLARMLEKRAGERPTDGNALADALSSVVVSGTDALLPARPSARPPAMTAREQRLVSVVLAVHLHALDGGDAIDAQAPTEATDEGEHARLREAAGLPAGSDARSSTRSASLERLSDGTLVCAFWGTAPTARAARMAREIVATSVPPMRAAIATGRAALEGRLPLGEALERASRLVRRFEEGVVLDGPSAALLGSGFAPHPNLDEQEAYLLTAEDRQEEPVRTLLGQVTPCVGRERELRLLLDSFEDCVSDARRLPVVVVAAAGAGKTRLAHELVKEVRARGAEVWIGRGDPTRAGTPLGMIRQTLLSTTTVQDGEPLETRRTKVAARVARHVPEGQRRQVTAFIGEILGAQFSELEFPALRTARLDPMVMADQTRRAWEDFVIAECEAHPLVLVLDDLHWGDLATVSYVDSALRNVDEKPWMVLALARPEVTDLFGKLWPERSVQELRLGPLTRKASEALVRRVLGHMPGLGAHSDSLNRIVERAAGNAFFLEEMIRAVADGRGDAVPDTVLGMVEQRLLTLDVEARRVLRAGSLLGGTFWEGAVAAMVGGGDVREWLRVLCDTELIHLRPESRFRGEREYGFRHEVVREAANAMLLDQDRMLGHRLAAQWLERAGESDPAVVALHWEKAGEPSRAIDGWLRAGRLSLERSDLERAVAHAERGVACGAEGATLGDLRLLQAEAHSWRGATSEMDRCAREALSHLDADALDALGGARWFEAVRLATLSSERTGNEEAFVELTERALATPALEGAEVARDRALASAARASVDSGMRERALALLQAVATTGDDAACAFAARARASLALQAGDVGGYLEGESAAKTFSERAGDPRRVCAQLANVGFAHGLLGDDVSAERMLRAALADAQRLGLPRVAAGIRNNLGPVLSRLGRVDEARRVETEAADELARQGHSRMEGGSRIYLAEILLAAGDAPGARREAVRAAELLERSPPLRPYALAVLALSASACGDLPAALGAIVEAMRGVDEAEEGEAVIRLAHAEILHAVGDLATARASIGEANRILVARADKIVDRALRRSFLQRVPAHARTIALAAEWAEGSG